MDSAWSSIPKQSCEMASPTFTMDSTWPSTPKASREFTRQPHSRIVSRNESPAAWQSFWDQYRSLILMVVAQIFSSLMATTAKFLQTDNEEACALGTSQVLVLMMSITMLLSWLYMWLAKIPNAPFGEKSLRGLFLIRGVAGVFGIWGFYYSLRYLPLAEATIINFLAPMVAAFACTIILSTPLTLAQVIGGIVSLLGVTLVSQPWKLFSPTSLPAAVPSVVSSSHSMANTTMTAFVDSSISNVTSTQHLFALLGAFIGVIGGACGFVAMRSVPASARSHPIITVSYFATACTLLTALSLPFTPLDDFRWPTGFEWVLLVFLGTFALALQLLMTKSLGSGEGGSKALNMVYTQIVFAVLLDKLVWGVQPDLGGWLGGGLILASVVGVAVSTENAASSDRRLDIPRIAVYDEEEEIMLRVKGDDSEDDSY